MVRIIPLLLMNITESRIAIEDSHSEFTEASCLCHHLVVVVVIGRRGWPVGNCPFVGIAQWEAAVIPIATRLVFDPAGTSTPDRIDAPVRQLRV